MYPINAGIIVEDYNTLHNMIVVNDRPQAGSAYHEGRIELMINRLGSSSDNLGVYEGMRDYSNDNRGINISAKFFLEFSDSREKALRFLHER